MPSSTKTSMEEETINKRYLFAAITHGRAESPLSFCVSLMRLQSTLAKQKAQCTFVFVDTLGDALTLAARRSDQFDTFVVAETTIAFSPEFVCDMDHQDKHFVTGVYPIPHVDWGRARDHILDQESPEQVGLLFNADPGKATVIDGRWAKLTCVSHLGLFKLSREAILELAEKTRVGTSDIFMFMTDSISPEGTLVGPVERLCSLWGKDIWLDIQHGGAKSFGAMSYFGSVGFRTKSSLR